MEGFVFQMGGNFVFKWGVQPMGASVLMRNPEKQYIIQLFHIVFHNKELKLLLKSLIKFSWRNCDHHIIFQRFYRSSQQRCSMKKVFLEISQNFKRKHLCQSIFFNKVTGLGLLKRRLWHRSFHVNFEKFLRTTVLQNTSGRLLLVL